MTTRDTPEAHDGWTPQPQEQEQPPVFPTTRDGEGTFRVGGPPAPVSPGLQPTRDTPEAMLRWAVNRAEQRELEALAELDEAKATIARLRAALKRHGVHSPYCAWTRGGEDCDCGLRAALAPQAPR
jgi:hypothetical protein